MRFLVALAALGLVMSACGGGEPKNPDHRDALAALRRQIEMADKQQWNRQYQEIYPAQRASFSEAAYVRCQTRQTAGAGIKVNKVLEVYDEIYDVPGTDDRLTSVVLSVEYEVRVGDKKQSANVTNHEIKQDGRWYIAIADPSVYQQGRC